MSLDISTLGLSVKEVDRAVRSPEWFLRSALGFDPWEKQVEIANAVRDHKKVAVRSCHSSGKTAIAARIAMWFLFSHYPGKVVTTAPTYLQVEELLWREITSAHQNSKIPLGGRLYGKPLLEIGPQWFAIGIKPDETQPERFQGFHSENLLVIVDEASAVPEELYSSIDSLLTGENNRLLLISNPTRLHGTFYDAFHARAGGYKTIHISALETPNFTEGKIVRPYLITPEFVEEMKDKYGEDSDPYRIKVRGDFPLQEEMALIPLDWIQRALNRLLPLPPQRAVRAVASDPAAGGGSKTALGYREGDAVMVMEEWDIADTMQSTGRIAALAVEKNADGIMIDTTGVGRGVADRLREQGFIVYDVNFGDFPADRKTFRRKRDEMWWNLRERFRLGTISIPENPRLVAHLSSVHYTTNSAGQIVVERKEHVKAEGFESPDMADALVLLFAVEPERMEARQKQYHGVVLSPITRAFYPERDPRTRRRRIRRGGGYLP